MVKEKKLSQQEYNRSVKQLPSYAELIETAQREKQAAMDDLDKEVRLFKSGKVSESSLALTVKRTNKELHRLDKKIRAYIKNVHSNSKKILNLTERQRPTPFKETIKGMKSSGLKKKRTKKKRR